MSKRSSRRSSRKSRVRTPKKSTSRKYSNGAIKRSLSPNANNFKEYFERYKLKSGQIVEIKNIAAKQLSKDDALLSRIIKSKSYNKKVKHILKNSFDLQNKIFISIAQVNHVEYGEFDMDLVNYISLNTVLSTHISDTQELVEKRAPLITILAMNKVTLILTNLRDYYERNLEK